MKNLQNGLKEKICENRIAKKCFALLLALSMTVGFVMPYEEVFESAIMSAVAAGAEDERGNYMTEAYDTEPAGAINFGDHIKSVTVNGEPLDANNNVIAASGNKQSINANLQYEYTPGTAPVTLDERYIYYKLNGVKLENSKCGKGAVANDEDWSIGSSNVFWDNATASDPAYYSISEDGLIVIKFTNSYINDKIQGPSGNKELKGNVTVEGYVERDATASGDKIISFGNQQLTVQFDDVIKEGSKTSTMAIDSGNPVVHYTIQVENPGQNIDFTKYNFTDSLINSANKDKISGVKSNPAGCITYDNNGNIAFTNSAKDNSRFTIEYDYTPTAEELRAGTTLTNNVKIFNPNDDKDKAETSDEITLDPTYVKAEITKSGVPSYYSDTSNKGYIEWKIEVTGKYNFSLKDYFVTDEAFRFFNDNTKAEIVSVKDENENDVAYSPDWGNGKLTINGDAKKVIITYKTYVDNNGNQLTGRGEENISVHNTASVTPPGGTTPDGDGSDDVTYSEKTSVKKSGTNITIPGYDKLNKPASEETILQWTANITDFEGIQGDKTYTDTLGDNQWFTQEQINSIQVGNLTKDTDYKITTTEDSGKITGFTIKFEDNDTVKAIKNLTISYQSTANTIGIDFDKSATFTNNGNYDDTPDNGEIIVTRGPDPYAGKETFTFDADKKWGDEQHKFENPAFQLQYRIEGSTEWKDYGTPKMPWQNWDNLPKVDANGNAVYYRVLEKQLISWDNDGTFGDPGLTDYIVSYNYPNYDPEVGIKADQYTTRLEVTNTYKNFNATINKSWANIPNDSVKFDVTFTLWKKVGEGGTWTNTNQIMTLTTGQNSVSFNELPRVENGETVYYKVVENADNNKLSDYTVTYNNVAAAELDNHNDKCITGNNPTMTVTNTYEKIGVKVVKKWEGDNNNSAGSRPSDEVGITVTLKNQ